MTAFSKLVRRVDEYAEAVKAIQVAMHNPTTLEAANTIAGINDVVGQSDNGMIGEYECEIEQYGKAISWGLRGEPQEEVEKERARVAKVRAEDERRRDRTPEEIEEAGAFFTERALRDLIDTACREDRWTNGMATMDIVPRSMKQRREILARLRHELLGGSKATPAACCRICGMVTRWPERWYAEDICYSPVCAEKAVTK
jgi:hypothetical protein